VKGSSLVIGDWRGEKLSTVGIPKPRSLITISPVGKLFMAHVEAMRKEERTCGSGI
jgi:hypothetical protein